MLGVASQGFISFSKSGGSDIILVIIVLACANWLVTPMVAIAINFFRRASATAAIPRWEQAMSRWQTFYYCHRDDVVFIPGTMQCVSSYEMHRLL